MMGKDKKTKPSSVDLLQEKVDLRQEQLTANTRRQSGSCSKCTVQARRTKSVVRVTSLRAVNIRYDASLRRGGASRSLLSLREDFSPCINSAN
jgi:hypothetical protein